MNLQKLQEELTADEGCKFVTYKCTEDKLTFGIGHLVLESDPEYNLPVGTVVSPDRVTECFDRDIQSVLTDCERLYPDFYSLPEEAQLIIANMMFNMGRPRLSKFKGMKDAVDNRDWESAADEMVDSRWYNQVTNRADRLVERMRAVTISEIPV